MINRIAIGTAQFGWPYGIANQNGQVSVDQGRMILQAARAAGVDTLDTAIAYGASEQVLGEIGVGDWRVISKLPPIPVACPDPQRWIQAEVDASLARLRVTRLAGLLLHQPMQLLERRGGETYQCLLSLKQRGMVEKIGFSIYSPAELDALWSHYPPDLVQAPFNILDRRLESSGWLQRMRSAGTEVHTRSTFLQGLLLMDSAARPVKFERWNELWARWDSWLDEQAITPLQAALTFVLSKCGIDRIIVGVDGVSQLAEIFGTANAPVTPPPDCLSVDDESLINPSKWASI